MAVIKADRAKMLDWYEMFELENMLCRIVLIIFSCTNVWFIMVGCYCSTFKPVGDTENRDQTDKSK